MLQRAVMLVLVATMHSKSLYQENKLYNCSHSFYEEEYPEYEYEEGLDSFCHRTGVPNITIEQQFSVRSCCPVHGYLVAGTCGQQER